MKKVILTDGSCVLIKFSNFVELEPMNVLTKVPYAHSKRGKQRRTFFEVRSGNGLANIYTVCNALYSFFSCVCNFDRERFFRAFKGWRCLVSDETDEGNLVLLKGDMVVHVLGSSGYYPVMRLYQVSDCFKRGTLVLDRKYSVPIYYRDVVSLMA